MRERDWANLGMALALAVTAACAKEPSKNPSQEDLVATRVAELEKASTQTVESLPTETPMITQTPTETATPTPEVVNYGICETEKFRDCPIPAEDLFNGKYLAFLETLSTPFDPSTMKVVPWTDAGLLISPNPDNSPNFSGVSTIGQDSGADFRRGVTSGLVFYEGTTYLILPVEYYDSENPNKNVWVITVYPIWEGEIKEGDDASLAIKIWKDLMKLNPIVPLPTDPFGDNSYDLSLVKKSFEENPDMAQRIQDFVGGHKSALHGKVLLTIIAVGPNDTQVPFFN